MKQFLIGVAVTLLVGAGIYGLLPKSSHEQVLGGIGQSGSFNPYIEVDAHNGFSYNRIKTETVGNATTATSSLASAASGFIAIPTSGTTLSASTTAVTANTHIHLYQIATSTGATSLNADFLTKLGTTQCSQTNATFTPITSVFASTTNTSLSGFKVTIPQAFSTNPICYAWTAVGY